MKIKDRVQVIAHDYEIIRKSIRETEKHGYVGVCNKFDKTITIPDENTPSTAETLLHEIGHAIYSEMLIPDPADEERVVDAFAKGWMAVCRNNPWLKDLLFPKS